MPIVTHTKKIVVILILMLMAGSGVLYGAYAIIKNNSRKASELEAQAIERQAQERRDQALAALIEDIQPERAALASRYVSSEGTVDFIEKLETLATENGLTRTVGSVLLDPKGAGGTGDAPEGYEWLKLNLTTVGSWENTYRFLSLLEVMSYKMYVTTASLSAGGSTSQDGKPPVSGAWEGRYFISVLKRK